MIRNEQYPIRRDVETARWNRWLAALLVLATALVFGASGARAETRSLKVYFVHTGEKADIVFKRNGRYDQAGLKKLNQFLRDWRRNEPTRMDPRLLDLIWSVYQSVGARDYIHVVCGYRSPGTNSMLRSRSKGVAEKSQHILGKAMDFYIPGVSLKKLREAGMKMQVGGVGYYPRSGSPFVHMDVGNVRHWPKMSRSELVRLFPNGNTLHVPSDGKPLPGFQQALASYQARKKSGATAIAMASGGAATKKSTNLLAAFFGGGSDEEEDTSDAEAAPAPKPLVKAAPPKVVAEAPAETKPLIEIIPPNKAKRTELVPLAEPEAPVAEQPVETETPEAIIAALPARDIPIPGLAPRPQAEVGPAPMATASIAEPAPQDIPFGMAQPDQPQADEQQVVAAAPQPPEDVPFGMTQDPPAELRTGTAVEADVASAVPLPSWRPDEPGQLAAAAQPDTSGADDSLMLALASADPEPLPAAEAFSVIPTARPTADDEEFPISALPDTAPQPSLAPELGAEDKAAVAAEIRANGERVAALTSVGTASPKLAIAARAPGTDPASAIGVKTTRKSARASVGTVKRAPRSLAVAVEPDAARWVLSKDYVTKTTKGTKAPSFAYNVVVSAPREVYTAGFQKGEQVADANRFTGKAVRFMTVARFE